MTIADPTARASREGPSCRFRGTRDDYDRLLVYVDRWLKFWHTDHLDIVLVSSYKHNEMTWDLTPSIEAFVKLKKDGKIRFCGFGTHFSPDGFAKALEKYGKAVDVVSVPYNVRHRAAEQIMPVADKMGLGIVTIKAFARGSLLNKKELAGKDAGLPRDLMAFVLENPLVDVAICGVPTLAHVKENFSSWWTPLTPEGRKRLEVVSATPCPSGHADWLERDWRLV
jgi:aryl-alcohol dehydrogenase-like predicted oxidoreductase